MWAHATSLAFLTKCREPLQTVTIILHVQSCSLTLLCHSSYRCHLTTLFGSRASYLFCHEAPCGIRTTADCATNQPSVYNQPTDESHWAGDETRLGSPSLPLYKPCWLHKSDWLSSSSDEDLLQASLAQHQSHLGLWSPCLQLNASYKGICFPHTCCQALPPPPSPFRNKEHAANKASCFQWHKATQAHQIAVLAGFARVWQTLR